MSERFHNVFSRRRIARSGTLESEGDLAAGMDDEHASLPKRIALNLARRVTGEERAKVIPHRARSEKRKNSPAEARQLEGPSLRVAQDRDVGDPQLALQRLRKHRSAGSDDRHVAAGPTDHGDMRPKLGQLLATKHSTEMADEDQDAGTPLPDFAEPMRLLVDVEDLDLAELRMNLNRFRHALWTISGIGSTIASTSTGLFSELDTMQYLFAVSTSFRASSSRAAGA